MFEEANQNVTAAYGRIALYAFLEFNHDVLPQFCYNASTNRSVISLAMCDVCFCAHPWAVTWVKSPMTNKSQAYRCFRFVRTKLPFVELSERDRPPAAAPHYLWGSKVGSFLKVWCVVLCASNIVVCCTEINVLTPNVVPVPGLCHLQNLSQCYTSIYGLYQEFFGPPHLEALCRLLEYSDVAVLMKELLEVIKTMVGCCFLCIFFILWSFWWEQFWASVAFSSLQSLFHIQFVSGSWVKSYCRTWRRWRRSFPRDAFYQDMNMESEVRVILSIWIRAFMSGHCMFYTLATLTFWGRGII